VTLKSAQRELALIAPDVATFVLFVTAVRDALDNSPLTKEHPFGSFSPVRNNCFTEFYNDGEGYFRDLYLELKSAKKYIYITDWMITPYFNLVRGEADPDKEGDGMASEFRLDKVLEEAAKRGVAIYIIIYQ
jgi:phospholipase D1/2